MGVSKFQQGQYRVLFSRQCPQKARLILLFFLKQTSKKAPAYSIKQPFLLLIHGQRWLDWGIIEGILKKSSMQGRRMVMLGYFAQILGLRGVWSHRQSRQGKSVSSSFISSMPFPFSKMYPQNMSASRRRKEDYGLLSWQHSWLKCRFINNSRYFSPGTSLKRGHFLFPMWKWARAQSSWTGLRSMMSPHSQMQCCSRTKVYSIAVSLQKSRVFFVKSRMAFSRDQKRSLFGSFLGGYSCPYSLLFCLLANFSQSYSSNMKCEESLWEISLQSARQWKQKSFTLWKLFRHFPQWKVVSVHMLLQTKTKPFHLISSGLNSSQPSKLSSIFTSGSSRGYSCSCGCSGSDGSMSQDMA